ncbi:MAG: acyl-CoA thioesterase [Candidatus Omnitrophica bacterium]|nr:acyl-CoA thioesterase [Candidatus Omnitrophota bacterium]
MFTYKTQIYLHDTDAAGLIFFANQLKIVHNAYEQLLEKFGCSFQSMLRGGKYFLPIVHAESDYKTPLFVGDQIAITVRVGHIGHTSFSFEYILKRGKTLVGTVKTVHVSVNTKTRRKMPLPMRMRKALETYAKKQ